MINNDILRRVSKLFDIDNKKILAVFSLGQYEISEADLALLFKEKDDAQYIALSDVALASFLNGLIVEKRGAKDGPQRQAEQIITNNIIFNKLKIALALKADEVIATLDLAEYSMSKYELSALFRNVNHKHYKECSDEVLNAFLKGLTLK